ncbi:MAG: hypothetical protein AAF772_18605, partial [Acidobacteriota bacterium]
MTSTAITPPRAVAAASAPPSVAPRPRAANDASRADRAALDDLVARAQAGDVEAFECLYRQHVGRIYAL